MLDMYKRVGKRLRDLKAKLFGQILSDGKTIDGKGPFTENVINKLQGSMAWLLGDTLVSQRE